ncbi:uncharacterized protein PHACADRAFT_256363 [Phanerochaete carnosa HHB-10118-sp]|uniref:Enhancer of mRNA-decapping protein 4 WD40 repeat region domain-containing protein n=1 Tax=Phanerochaete carnosa (strain HHB-10118-sp) TaxID=650164 RepID=K5VVP9_PHACS|nr:uncharacterized protein PHACADRAFT_256363 [Phanerochaete carnosa HHB-10118-sp]EKM55623.1 hypothetical protein PHACADRAFT_256363 [Phanerochaete carnosa HHB-10118-sp]
MDPGSRDNLFSRGPSPPPQPQLYQQGAPAQVSDPHPPAPPSTRESAPTAHNTLDTLFHGLTASAPQQASQQPPSHASNVYAVPQDVPHSGPATPASVNAGSVSSSHSGPSNTTADRQNALLSLLGTVTSPPSNPQAAPSFVSMPQQVPTPPGSAPRVGQTSNEQTKFLLDQLMSGPKYNNEPQPSTYPPLASGGPSPTYLPSNADSQSHSQGEFYSAESYGPSEQIQPSEYPEAPLNNQTNQRPPSPGRRSLFDFVSPFDALASPPQQSKRKPVPPQQPPSTDSTGDSSWTNVTMDPKRKSVENLMDQITRGQGPLQPPAQSVTAQFDPYAPSEELSTPQAEQAQTRASRPLPPHPTQQQQQSPRASPPKVPAQARQQRQSVDSPIGPPAPQGSYYQQPRKEKESSPFRPIEPQARGKGNGGKGKAVAAPQQTIIFDVAQSLEEIRAPPDAVKSTAIALVKVDSTFLPGTTIGATHWVAYAMTKGRVRVISRSSGDRTLLQLPSLFPTSVAVSDMSVHGNRLAGVTSDGGFVVWELPELIRDDVPGKIVLCVLPSTDMDPLHADQDSEDAISIEEGGKTAEAKGKSPEAPSADVTAALTKEIRKVEENLHTRIGRMIGKELDKQHQRLEDARANEQAADFVRQEKILKLISTELTKNTTRVVEMAVKAEVQSSVLPALENITKTEVKAALNNQISKGLAESMKQNLPNEIERLLLRPDVSNHIARTFSGAVTPIVEKHVKDAITKTLIPTYSQQSSQMHQELSREIHGEILNLKKEIITWQSEALRGQEAVIRDLEQSVRVLSDQIKYLTMNVGSSGQLNLPAVQRGSPASLPSAQHSQGNLSQLRHANIPLVSQQPPSSYAPPQHGPFPQQQQQAPQQPLPPPQSAPWFPTNIAAPQASHPVAPPPAPQAVNRTPPLPQNEEWDDTYLAVLGSQDSRQLRELLARSNPEIVMPTTSSGPLSQAVVLTLVHRLSQIIGETPPVDESFKSSLWWLQRAASTLNTSDPLISPYVSRVLPSVQQMLNTTKQRLAILPGGPLMPETARTISDVQDMLARKPM